MKTPQEGIFNKRRWNKMFRRLVAYNEKHQTTNVPCRCKEDPYLTMGNDATKKFQSRNDIKAASGSFEFY